MRMLVVMDLRLKSREACRPEVGRHRVRISCQEGLVWVTRAGDSRDYIAKPGEALTVPGGGRLVVMALEDSCFTLESQPGLASRTENTYHQSDEQKELNMQGNNQKITLKLENTSGVCKIGEAVGQRNIDEERVPVLSCEGACIRGEIARLAANLLAKRDGFARACHGELMTVPHSAIAQWSKAAPKTILIDGCGLRCHGRILEELLGAERLVQFNAVSVYKKYSDIFDADDVPEAERREAAEQVAAAVLAALA